MKTLQNDFTTPEQSKRLLELGVPADSANCYYDGRKILRARSEAWMLEPNFFKEYSYFTPCWSVGRLIEIFEICTPYIFTGFHNYIGTHTEVMIKIYESVICHPVKNFMDFSKLED